VTAVPKGVAWRRDDDEGGEGGDGGAKLEQLVDFIITSEDDGEGNQGSHSGNMVSRTLADVRMSLVGPHQRDNARTALAVLEFLRKGGGQGPDDCDGGEGWAISDDDMRRGLEAAESPGCFETVVVPPAPPSHLPGGGGDGGGGGGLGCAVVADGAHTKVGGGARLNAVDP
jgi:folylpolyglutamate synthase/dihydropteroate synthase